jgi:hypothetical protein
MTPPFADSPALEPWLWFSSIAIAMAAIVWVVWVRRSLDHSCKVHCRDCNFVGHPRFREQRDPAVQTVHDCPDCGSRRLVPVMPRRHGEPGIRRC